METMKNSPAEPSTHGSLGWHGGGTAMTKKRRKPIKTGLSFLWWKTRNLPLGLLRAIVKRGMVRTAPALDDEQIFEVREHLQVVRRVAYEPREILLAVASKQEKMRLQAVKKEPWTVSWIENYVRPGEVLYDVGANVGVYALLAAKCTQGQARVYAFEPSFATYASLCANVIRNGCQDAITPLPVALSEVTGLIRFNFSSLTAGASFHGMGERRAGKAPSATPQTPYVQSVMAYRLDDLVPALGLALPTHVKLDVDGAETQVLQGATSVLSHPGLRTLMVEMGDSDSQQAKQIVNLLAARGFGMAKRHDRAEKQFSYALFVRGDTLRA